MIREWFWRSFHPLWIYKIVYKNKNSFRRCGMDGKPLSNGFVALVVSPLYLEPHFCSTEKRIFRHGVVTTSCMSQTESSSELYRPVHTTLWVNPDVCVWLSKKREINVHLPSVRSTSILLLAKKNHAFRNTRCSRKRARRPSSTL